MKKFLSFLTILFLLSAIITIALLAIAEKDFFFKAGLLIKDNVWLAGLAMILLLGLLSAGIVSNLHNPDGTLISNGYFQTAVFVLFLMAGSLVYLWYQLQQPGTIILQLDPASPKQQLKMGLTYQSLPMDTITAPGELSGRPAGKYLVEILDMEIQSYKTGFDLDPGETEKIVIPVALNFKTLRVNTDPENAEIWIDNLQAGNTPYTFEISGRDTVYLELKMSGYQSYVDTVQLSENVDLGTIPLVKLYTLRISCAYEDYQYMIYDSEAQLVFSGRDSRAVQLPAGNYKVAYEIGEGQFETKSFSVSRNTTLSVP